MFENRYKSISTMFFHSDSHQFKIFMRSRYNTKVLSLAKYREGNIDKFMLVKIYINISNNKINVFS